MRIASIRPVVSDVAAVLRAHWYLRRARSIGSRVRLRGRPAVVARGDLVIDERVQLVSTIARLELFAERGASLHIGARCLVNFGTSIVALDRVSIGKRCLIGTHCMITDTPFHDVDPDRRLEPPKAQPVTIGDNVWIGARVVVLPGVTIGDDAVVGVGSIVTSDIPPRTLAVGVPARVVRDL
jgi:maltose O-acetyltransferase